MNKKKKTKLYLKVLEFLREKSINKVVVVMILLVGFVLIANYFIGSIKTTGYATTDFSVLNKCTCPEGSKYPNEKRDMLCDNSYSSSMNCDGPSTTLHCKFDGPTCSESLSRTTLTKRLYITTQSLKPASPWNVKDITLVYTTDRFALVDRVSLTGVTGAGQNVQALLRIILEKPDGSKENLLRPSSVSRYETISLTPVESEYRYNTPEIVKYSKSLERCTPGWNRIISTAKYGELMDEKVVSFYCSDEGVNSINMKNNLPELEVVPTNIKSWKMSLNRLTGRIGIKDLGTKQIRESASSVDLINGVSATITFKIKNTGKTTTGASKIRVIGSNQVNRRDNSAIMDIQQIPTNGIKEIKLPVSCDKSGSSKNIIINLDYMQQVVEKSELSAPNGYYNDQRLNTKKITLKCL